MNKFNILLAALVLAFFALPLDANANCDGDDSVNPPDEEYDGPINILGNTPTTIGGGSIGFGGFVDGSANVGVTPCENINPGGDSGFNTF